MMAALLATTASVATCRRAAIVTGGTRGIGLGIAEALASNQFDLLLTYNRNAEAAAEAAARLRGAYGCAVECVGGDITLEGVRDAVFSRYDDAYGSTHELCAVVHNAGQYVGVTSDNAERLTARALYFGDGSLGTASAVTSVNKSGCAKVALKQSKKRFKV